MRRRQTGRIPASDLIVARSRSPVQGCAMTAGPTTRTFGLVATLFASLVSFQAACGSGSPEIAFAPSVCNLGEQQTKLAGVVTTVAFNPLVLGELGVTVQTEGATGAAPQRRLSILP